MCICDVFVEGDMKVTSLREVFKIVSIMYKYSFLDLFDIVKKE